VGLDRVRDVIQGVDARLWLLIGVGLGLLLTIQAVEGSVEGAWPHQRRVARLAPGARAVHGLWSWVAFFLLPGMLLAAVNLALLLWQNLPQSQIQVLGGFFVGLTWLLFVLASFDIAGLGRYMSQVGPVGPAALLLLVLAGDLLLLIGLLDILPGFEAIRQALPIVGR
jgi:hypothetical protein